MVSHDVEPHRDLANAILDAVVISDTDTLQRLLPQTDDKTRDFIFERTYQGLHDPESTALTQSECVRIILSYPKNVPAPLALPAILEDICHQRRAIR